VRAALVHEGQNRTIIEEYTAVPVTARSSALATGQLYHADRAISPDQEGQGARSTVETRTARLGSFMSAGQTGACFIPVLGVACGIATENTRDAGDRTPGIRDGLAAREALSEE